MINFYIYILDTMADWEIGYITAEVNSRRFFKKNAQEITVKTISLSESPIKTMGGLTVLPDLTIDEMEYNQDSVLLLPGSNIWNDDRQQIMACKAKDLLDAGGTVCAICGATNLLANYGILDEISHTSNGSGYLEAFCPSYHGTSFYIDEPAVEDGNLITAGSHGGLEFAKLILKHLNVFKDDTLEYWYKYFKNGKAEDFYQLMNSLDK